MNAPRLYTDLADWWPVMSSPGNYVEEAGIFADAIEQHAGIPVREVLELGSGGGNNASHLKAHFDMTLVDRSEGMLAASRALNPGCEHHVGDMRSVRLGRTFDAVFVHDAIMYMTTEDDLRAVFETARVHCRPDGLCLFVPDCTTETFEAGPSHGGHDLGDRSLRYLEWEHDTDPSATTYTCSFAFMLREGGGPVRCVIDEHEMGRFPRATWMRLIEAAGFRPHAVPYLHSDFDPDAGLELFLGLPPGCPDPLVR